MVVYVVLSYSMLVGSFYLYDDLSDHVAFTRMISLIMFIGLGKVVGAFIYSNGLVFLNFFFTGIARMCLLSGLVFLKFWHLH